MPANQLCNRLINEYGDAVFRMCYLYLKDYHLAEDAAQETFIKAVQSHDSFRHESKEKTWLIRIAINCCKNIMRTRWFRMMRVDIQEYRELKSEKNPIQELELKDTISNAIMELKKDDRVIILLYYYQELSIKEIASIIRKTENATIQKLNRARKKLRELLKEDFDEIERKN